MTTNDWQKGEGMMLDIMFGFALGYLACMIVEFVVRRRYTDGGGK